mmetsp:Transcript_31114/g.87639  ORF Transcript_31114/g.87639 Transcript_31114/m.87639 type:complete len:595 (-) Transcript_31114:494-2278(-)
MENGCSSARLPPPGAPAVGGSHDHHRGHGVAPPGGAHDAQPREESLHALGVELGEVLVAVAVCREGLLPGPPQHLLAEARVQGLGCAAEADVLQLALRVQHLQCPPDEEVRAEKVREPLQVHCELRSDRGVADAGVHRAVPYVHGLLARHVAVRHRPELKLALDEVRVRRALREAWELARELPEVAAGGEEQPRVSVEALPEINQPRRLQPRPRPGVLVVGRDGQGHPQCGLDEDQIPAQPMYWQIVDTDLVADEVEVVVRWGQECGRKRFGLVLVDVVLHALEKSGEGVLHLSVHRARIVNALAPVPSRLASEGERLGNQAVERLVARALAALGVVAYFEELGGDVARCRHLQQLLQSPRHVFHGLRPATSHAGRDALEAELTHRLVDVDAASARRLRSGLLSAGQAVSFLDGAKEDNLKVVPVSHAEQDRGVLLEFRVDGVQAPPQGRAVDPLGRQADRLRGGAVLRQQLVGRVPHLVDVRLSSVLDVEDEGGVVQGRALCVLRAVGHELHGEGRVVPGRRDGLGRVRPGAAGAHDFREPVIRSSLEVRFRGLPEHTRALDHLDQLPDQRQVPTREELQAGNIGALRHFGEA